MDFDEMLATWRTQDTTPPHDVNRDALQQALQTEETRGRRAWRSRRRVRWFLGIFGTGMAVWAGFWIAITITNGWPAIYAIAAGVSLGMFALAAGASWVGRGREPERNFGNTLQEEVGRCLALVNYQLSVTRRWIIHARDGFHHGWRGAVLLDGSKEPRHPRIVPRRMVLVCGRVRCLGAGFLQDARRDAQGDAETEAPPAAFARAARCSRRARMTGAGGTKVYL